jgi:hypothetical protein
MITPNTRVRNEANIVEILRRPDAVKQADENTFYLGFSWAGAQSLDAPMWSIERLTLNPATGIVQRMYPNGNKRQCIFRFSECETYPYLLPV